MAKDLQPMPEGRVTRYPVVDRRRGVRFAAMGTNPTGHKVADGQIVYVLPDQINIGGPIDAGHAGMLEAGEKMASEIRAFLSSIGTR